MRIGHAINTLILNSTFMVENGQAHGYARPPGETMSVHLLASENVIALLARPFQLRL